LTAKEDQLVLESVRARSAQYLSAYSVEDPDLVVLLDKIQTQLYPVVEAVVEPEVDKAAEAAFLADVPHEEFIHEDDIVQDEQK
jgi:hypothetical protein